MELDRGRDGGQRLEPEDCSIQYLMLSLKAPKLDVLMQGDTRWALTMQCKV